MRMLMNNLDPDVAEDPDQLIIYGGTGRAARSWEAFDAIVRSLKELENDESLLVQSGKPIGKFKTHDEAPRVLIANSNLVGQWNNYAEFNRLERLGLTMYGQMTAGSWIYIGSQGIVQGTFETFAAAGRKHFGGSLEGKFVLTGGLGGPGRWRAQRQRPRNLHGSRIDRRCDQEKRPGHAARGITNPHHGGRLGGLAR